MEKNNIYEYIMNRLNEGQELDEIVKAVTAEINTAKKDYDEVQKQSNKVKKYRIELMQEIAANLYELLNTFDFNIDDEFLNGLADLSDKDAEELVDLIEKEFKTFFSFKNSLEDLLSALKIDNNNPVAKEEKKQPNKDNHKDAVIADFPNLMNFLTGLN